MLTPNGRKGRIVIEKTIRDTVQKFARNHLEIHAYPPEHKLSLRGILADKIKKPVPTTEWSILREQAWSAIAASDEHKSNVDE